MSDHICRNCEYWNGPLSGFAMRGECLLADADDSLMVMGFFDLETTTPIDRPRNASFSVMTHACFGCVQWEGKE